MPFVPNNNDPVTTDTPIDSTLTTAGAAQDLVAVPVNTIGRKIGLINRGPGDAAVAFDRTAAITDTLVKQGEAYSEEGLAVSTKVSFINVTVGKKPRITGILWSG